jgi:Ras-related protein Rab-6A
MQKGSRSKWRSLSGSFRNSHKVSLQMENAPIQKYKVVLLGEQSVGKTAILSRFMYDTFDSTYQATIGIDYFGKTIYTPERTVKLQFWDTAGQERFRSLIPNYIRDSKVAIICFDITSIHVFNLDVKSFQATMTWAQDSRIERGSDLALVLVGNKCDLDSDRKVSTEEAEEMARKIDANYIEVSAKSGNNIKTLFRKVVDALPQFFPPTRKGSIQLQQSMPQSVGSLCNC